MADTPGEPIPFGRWLRGNLAQRSFDSLTGRLRRLDQLRNALVGAVALDRARLQLTQAETLRPPHVRGGVGDVTAAFRHATGQCLEAVVPDIPEDNLGAVSGKQHGVGFAHPAAGAGDDYAFPLISGISFLAMMQGTTAFLPKSAPPSLPCP